MDAKNIHQIALKTSKSLAEAMQFNRDVLEALQLLAGISSSGLDQKSVGDAEENLFREPSKPDLDTSWRQTISDFASMSSSARASENLQPSSDADWLHARPSFNLSNSSSAQLELLNKLQKIADPTATAWQQKCSHWGSTGDISSAATSAAAAAGSSGTAENKLPHKGQDEVQSTAWEKAQNRLLTVVDARRGKLRRSMSAAEPEGRRSHHHHRTKPQVPQQPATNKKTKKKASITSATPVNDNNGRKSAAATKSSDALTSSPAPTLLPHFGAVKKSKSKKKDKPVPNEDHKALMAGPPAEPPGHAEDSRRHKLMHQNRESACLRSVDCLLQACRQALDHPSLATAYADTVGRLARDLLTRLEPYYSSEADRPFPISTSQLEQVWQSAQAAADTKISGLTQIILGRLIDCLPKLRAQLEFHMCPEAALLNMETSQRLRSFSEYCYLLLRDCKLLAPSQGTSSAPATSSHSAVLLALTRYFVGNQHLMGPSIRMEDRALLMRCYERLEKLHEGVDSAATAATLIEQRVRKQCAELGNDLAALCDLLVVRSDEYQQHGNSQHLQAHGALALSPRSCDARSGQDQQISGCSPDLTAICVSADRIIRHLKRLVESPTDSSASQADRLAKSVTRLTTACERSGLRVKEAYLDKLRQLRKATETTCSNELRRLDFEFFYSVLTDTLLFRRSLGRRIGSTGGSEAGSHSAATHSPSAVGRREVASLLSLISSMVCDLYLAVASNANESVIFTCAFQADLGRLIDLVNRRGLTCLDSGKKRKLRQCLLKLMGHMKNGSSNSTTASGCLRIKSLDSLIRLLLEIRLNLDRENLASSIDLLTVEKTVPFSALPRYLALRGSRVVHFTGWSQDTAQLRGLLLQGAKDPAVLRLERQCRCQVTLLLGEHGAAAVAGVTRWCRPKNLLLAVDMRASHGSHTACIRLLNDALKAKRLTLEPCEATVQVPVQL